MSKLVCGTVDLCTENYDHSSENKSNIKLFKINLPVYYNSISILAKYLNADELDRAQKYHFEKDVNQFIVCRALLKLILARHTGLKLSEIKIEKDKNKKPYLPSQGSLHFNLSHAKDYAIIAIGNSAIGVDLEYLNRDFDFAEILHNSFSGREKQLILAANNKTEAFFKLWTRKEAVVKATGKGIDDSFREIPSIDGLHLKESSLLGEIPELYVYSFGLDNEYIGALATSAQRTHSEKVPLYIVPSEIPELKTGT